MAARPASEIARIGKYTVDLARHRVSPVHPHMDLQVLLKKIVLYQQDLMYIRLIPLKVRVLTFNEPSAESEPTYPSQSLIDSVIRPEGLERISSGSLEGVTAASNLTNRISSIIEKTSDAALVWIDGIRPYNIPFLQARPFILSKTPELPFISGIHFEALIRCFPCVLIISVYSLVLSCINMEVDDRTVEIVNSFGQKGGYVPAEYSTERFNFLLSKCSEDEIISWVQAWAMRIFNKRKLADRQALLELVEETIDQLCTTAKLLLGNRSENRMVDSTFEALEVPFCPIPRNSSLSNFINGYRKIALNVLDYVRNVSEWLKNNDKIQMVEVHSTSEWYISPLDCSGALLGLMFTVTVEFRSLRKCQLELLVDSWSNTIDELVHGLWREKCDVISLLCCRGSNCWPGLINKGPSCRLAYVESGPIVVIWLRIGSNAKWVNSLFPLVTERILQAVY